MNTNRYRLIFDKHLNIFRPVAECVVSRSDVSSRVGETASLSPFKVTHKVLNWAIAAALLLPWSNTWSQTLPTGGQVGVGAGSIQQSGSTMNIHQQSQKMGINWQSYNIGAGNTVNYQQHNAQAIAINRVIGNSRSEIYGNLNANGKVFLINQNGILFGRNAQINVGGLLATTKNMSDEDFMNEQYHLLGNSASEIINQGNLHAENGTIVLAADSIKNTGTISTPNGRVILAAGEKVNLSLDVLGKLRAKVTQKTLDALIDNKGLIAADNGEVYLTAHGKEMLQKSVINMEGVIQAKSGKVKIDGSNADDGGNVIINDGTIDVSNDGSENNGKGGSVTVIGKNIGLLGNAKIKADGKYGGGTVLIGGDYLGTGDIPHAQAVVMQKDALIEASATDSGKGGKVILWSDKYTGFFGAINAKGGVNGGDGGFVETSSKDTLSVIGGRVKANAENGQRGEWLLDPGNVNIRANINTTATLSNMSPPITWEGIGDVLNTDITDALNTDTDVTITTGSSGSMRQWADISKTSTGNATLTLDSAGYLELDGNITSSGGNLNLNFTAGTHILKRNTSNIDVTGNIDMSAGSYLDMYNNITSGGDLNLTSGTYMQQLAGANINVSGNIGISSGNIFRAYDDIISGGDFNINASNRIELHTGSNIDVGGNIDISSTNNHIVQQGDINAVGNIDMSSGTYLDMYKNITSGGDLNLNSGTYMQQLAGANINVSGNIGISSGNIFRAYDDIISGGDFTVNIGDRIDLLPGTNIDVGGKVDILSRTQHISQQGDINAVGNIDMSAGNFINMHNNITSSGDLNLNSVTYMQQLAGANINVSGNIGISSGNIFRAYDDIISDGDLNINAAANIELHSTSNIDVDGSIEASSGAINFLRGNITAGSNMTPKDIILIGGNGLRVDTHPIVIDSHGGDITISGNTTTANYRGVSIDRDLTLNAGSSGVVNMTGITNSATHAGFRADGNVDITAAQVNIMGHNIHPTSTNSGSRGLVTVGDISVHGSDLFMNATRASNNIEPAALWAETLTADGHITIVSDKGYAGIYHDITAGTNGTPKNIDITSTSGGVVLNYQAVQIDSHGGNITITGNGNNMRQGFFSDKALTINAGSSGVVNMTGITNSATHAGFRSDGNVDITAAQVNIMGHNIHPTSTNSGSRGLVTVGDISVHGSDLFMNATRASNNIEPAALWAETLTADGHITIVSDKGYAGIYHDITAGTNGTPKNIDITSTSGGVVLNYQAVQIDSHGGNITITGNGNNMRQGFFSDKALTINAGTTGVVNITGTTEHNTRAGVRLWDNDTNITASQVNLVGYNNYTGGSPNAGGRGILTHRLKVIGGNLSITGNKALSDGVASSVLTGNVEADKNIIVISEDDYVNVLYDLASNNGNIGIFSEDDVKVTGTINASLGNVDIVAGKDKLAGSADGTGEIVRIGTGNVIAGTGKVINLYTGGATLSATNDDKLTEMRALLSGSPTHGSVHYNANNGTTPANALSVFNVFARKRVDATVASNQATWTKTYDGVSNISGINLTINTEIKGDIVTSNNTIIADFSDSNVGSYVTNNYEIPSNVAVSNTNFSSGVYGITVNTSNYTATPNVTINVTQRDVTVWWASGGSKTYDGNTDASAAIMGSLITSVPQNLTPPNGFPNFNIATSADGGYLGGSINNSGVVLGEDLMVSQNFVFDDHHVNTGIGISVDNVALANGSNGFASNYRLVHANGSDHAINMTSIETGLVGDINVRDITISAVTDSKTYDGTDTSSGTPTVTGLLGGDTLSGLLQTFSTARAGNNITLNADGGSASINTTNVGSQLSDYNVQIGSTALGTIAQRDVTVDAVTDSKTYDGTDTSSGAPMVTGLLGGDTVSGLLQTFSTARAGNNITLNADAGPVSISTTNVGSQLSDYNVQVGSTALGAILKRDITVNAVADTKTYDGTDTSSVLPSVTGLLSGDTLSGLLQSFSSSRTGSNVTLNANIESAAINTSTVGSLLSDYNVQVDRSATGNIAKRVIFIDAVVDTKVYDGGTTSAQTPLAAAPSADTGLLSGDSVAGLTQSFDQVQVQGESASVLNADVTHYSVQSSVYGSTNDDYDLQVRHSAIGTINKRALVITLQDATVTEGEDYVPRYQYTGFSDGDSAASLGINPTLETKDISGVGEYTLIPQVTSNLVNYDIQQLVGGKVTVVPKPFDLESNIPDDISHFPEVNTIAKIIANTPTFSNQAPEKQSRILRSVVTAIQQVNETPKSVEIVKKFVSGGMFGASSYTGLDYGDEADVIAAIIKSVINAPSIIDPSDSGIGDSSTLQSAYTNIKYEGDPIDKFIDYFISAIKPSVASIHCIDGGIKVPEDLIDERYLHENCQPDLKRTLRKLNTKANTKTIVK